MTVKLLRLEDEDGSKILAVSNIVDILRECATKHEGKPLVWWVRSIDLAAHTDHCSYIIEDVEMLS